jgi:hypothetical protein
MNSSDIDKRSRKIDLDDIIDKMFKGISEIDASDKTQGQKTQSFRREADKVTRALYGQRAKNKSNAIAHNTASKYLTKIRNQVTAKGWLHHSLPATLERLVGKYPRCQHLIEALENQTLDNTRLGVKALKDKLLQINRLKKALAAVDVNDPRYASKINEIAKSFEPWQAEIQNLKPVNKDDRGQKVMALFEVFDDGENLFKELEGLKIDHEIMRWLVKDSFSSAVSSETSAFALATKKGHTIDIDYPTIMSRCEFLLSPINAEVWSWEALATGIALATGRRAIEVLVQGEFKKAGTYKLTFSGQAKERGGVDHENSFEIYSLIKADTVLAAIDTLRAYPKIESMISELNSGRHYQFNELVHNRTAAYLNDFMRAMMKDADMYTGIPNRQWVFKDTRAIYAAICFKLFFDTDKRWAKMDQDMFFQTLLGHSDPKAQAHYKQFKILRPGDKWESIVAEAKDRLGELKKFDAHADIADSKALARMHDNVKSLIQQDPDIKITQRAIKGNFGGNYETIRKYLAIVEEALSFDTTLDSILHKEVISTEKKKAKVSESKKPQVETEVEVEAEVIHEENNETHPSKPKFTIPKQLDTGYWYVIINHHDIDYDFTVDAKNSMEAMRIAWDEYQFCCSLPKTPTVLTLKKDGWWTAVIKHRGTIVCEVSGPGSRLDYVHDAITSYQENYSKYWQR